MLRCIPIDLNKERYCLCDGVLGYSDRAQHALDAGILWAASFTCLEPYHGLPVVRGFGGDNNPLAIGHMGWASIYALSGVGECCGSIEPVHGAPEPGSKTVGYGKFVSFSTIAKNKRLYISFAGHKSVSPTLKHVAPDSWVIRSEKCRSVD